MTAVLTAAVLASLVSAVVMHRVDVWWWRGAADRTVRRLARRGGAG
ncbi:hypothetical protein [Pilimelia terevasa]|nr:hypothetical protein [Pilimelia terevasa]